MLKVIGTITQNSARGPVLTGQVKGDSTVESGVKRTFEKR